MGITGGTSYAHSMANSPSGDAVLDRVMRLFAALEEQPSQTPGDLVAAARLPRTTGYRLIRELRTRGLLALTDGGEIVVGRRVWEIAQHAPIHRELRTAALPYMQDVNAVVRQTTQLSVLADDGALIVERLSRHGAVANPAEVATTMPAHLTSMGHVLLAFAPQRTAERWWAEHGDRAEAARPELRRELAEARRRGHGLLVGVINTETAGLSVPVLDPRGRALAALTVVVPRDSPEIPQFLMALQTAARGISRAMPQPTVPLNETPVVRSPQSPAD
ncbi:IclR family transcriptional regulator [Nesterenkonia xinjiangensis]